MSINVVTSPFSREARAERMKSICLKMKTIIDITLSSHLFMIRICSSRKTEQ